MSNINKAATKPKAKELYSEKEMKDCSSNPLIFQDLLHKYYSCNQSMSSPQSPSVVNGKSMISGGSRYDEGTPRNSLEDEISEIFFDLANAEFVGYRPTQSTTKLESLPLAPPSTQVVIVKQDNTCLNHTGGIVWETSYLLTSFLEFKYSKKATSISRDPILEYPLARTLEIGAGCGLLGLVLATIPLSTKVILTETNGPYENLNYNVQQYNSKLKSSSNTGNQNSKVEQKVKAMKLCWNNLERDIRKGGEDLQPHSFDTILGTDVVFTTELVIPMLKTLSRMSHSKTVIYLCLQERCQDAHAKLMQEAPRFFKMKDYTEKALSMIGCEWGKYMHCKLFRLKKIICKEKEKKRKRKQTKEKQKKSWDLDVDHPNTLKKKKQKYKKEI